MAPGGFGFLGSFVRFLTSGAFNTLATYLLYLGLLTRLPYRVSFSIAYVSGIGLAYAMNRYLVFRQPGGRAGPLLVALIYVGQYLLSLVLVTSLVHWLSMPPALAPLFATALTLPLTYLLNRRVFNVDLSDRTALTALNTAPTTLVLTWRKLRPWRLRIAMVVLVGLPILSLALNAIAWLRFGFDLPFFDDWRGYEAGDIDSLDLSYLFRPSNDTLTPIGFALDAIAQRLLGGNSVVYQLLSMVSVLGTLLLLQWKLLRSALGDSLRAAVAFVFTLLMLQPGSYWGRENLAYQQALPLVFILFALWVTATRPWRGRWNVPVIFVLGALAGFSYISGAFGALAAGVAVIAIALLSGVRVSRVPTLRAGASLALAGAASSLAQFVFAIAPSKGGTHVAGKAFALPNEADFWFYYLGKVGRSLLLPEDQPVLSLILVLLVLGLFVAVAVLIIGRARSAQPVDDRYWRLAMVFGAIGAMVFTYLLLVSAGRTNYRPDDVQTATEVFAYGFQRFHFFWATLLWPWLVAGVMVVGDRSVAPGLVRPLARPAGSVVVMTAVALMIWLGALGHFERHRLDASFRNSTVECLMDQLQKGEGIHCQEFNLPDLTHAYIYARQIEASFVRYFPVLPLELGVDSPPPWFRLSRDGDKVEARDLVRQAGLSYRAGDHPQLDITVGPPMDMAACAMLDVKGLIKTTGSDTVQLFFRPLGQREFTLASSASQPISGGPQASEFSFRAENALGFEKTLRLLPVTSKQQFELGEVEVRCRLRDRFDAVAPFYAMSNSTIPAELRNIEPIGDGEGRFRASALPRIVFRTGQGHTMASCRFLEVQANYQVETSDIGQLFFRPLGVDGFSEPDSLWKPVSPQPKPENLTFVAESASGFEDQLRLDPVRRPQALRFVDIKVRCLRRIQPPMSPR